MAFSFDFIYEKRLKATQHEAWRTIFQGHVLFSKASKRHVESINNDDDESKIQQKVLYETMEKDLGFIECYCYRKNVEYFSWDFEIFFGTWI